MIFVDEEMKVYTLRTKIRAIINTSFIRLYQMQYESKTEKDNKAWQKVYDDNCLFGCSSKTFEDPVRC